MVTFLPLIALQPYICIRAICNKNMSLVKYIILIALACLALCSMYGLAASFEPLDRTMQILSRLFYIYLFVGTHVIAYLFTKKTAIN